jgi:hypothetical protein
MIEMRADGDLHSPALGVLRVSQQISGQSPVMDRHIPPNSGQPPRHVGAVARDRVH